VPLICSLVCNPVGTMFSNFSSFTHQLRERNIWHAAVAYPAAAFVLLQAVEFFVNNYQLNAKLLTVSIIIFVGALPIALIWNWCHGQPGVQAVRRNEIWIYGVITTLTLFVAGWYWVTSAESAPADLAEYSAPVDMSIAVLPFASADSNSELDYLRDGIPESLIHALSVIPNLKVISRFSAFALRDQVGQPQEIGRQLDVDRMLSGQLERHDDNLVVHVTLIDTRDGRELWGTRLVRPMTEILELEEIITSDIAAALQLELPAGATPRRGSDSVDPVAYRHYLQGRFLAHGSTGAEIDRGLTHLREATAIDPAFAPSYAAIADAMIVKAFFSASAPTAIVGEARTAAQSAIALNPDLPEAYASLGSIRLFFDYDWPGSEEAFKQAISLGPTSSTAYYRYSNLLTALGRFDEAVQMAEKAVESDPISIGALHALGFAKLMGGDFEGAVAAFGNSIEIHPGWSWGYVKKSLAHALMGERDEALAMAQQTEELIGDWGSAFLQGWLAWVYSVTEQEELLQRVVDRVGQGIKENRIEEPFGVAITYLAVGDLPTALDWVEKTVDEQSPNAVFWNVGTADHMQLGPAELRESPRFIELLQRMNLTDD